MHSLASEVAEGSRRLKFASGYSLALLKNIVECLECATHSPGYVGGCGGTEVVRDMTPPLEELTIS